MDKQSEKLAQIVVKQFLDSEGLSEKPETIVTLGEFIRKLEEYYQNEYLFFLNQQLHALAKNLGAPSDLKSGLDTLCWFQSEYGKNNLIIQKIHANNPNNKKVDIYVSHSKREPSEPDVLNIQTLLLCQIDCELSFSFGSMGWYFGTKEFEYSMSLSATRLS